MWKLFADYNEIPYIRLKSVDDDDFCIDEVIMVPKKSGTAPRYITKYTEIDKIIKALCTHGARAFLLRKSNGELQLWRGNRRPKNEGVMMNIIRIFPNDVNEDEVVGRLFEMVANINKTFIPCKVIHGSEVILVDALYKDDEWHYLRRLNFLRFFPSQSQRLILVKDNIGKLYDDDGKIVFNSELTYDFSSPEDAPIELMERLAVRRSTDSFIEAKTIPTFCLRHDLCDKRFLCQTTIEPEPKLTVVRETDVVEAACYQLMGNVIKIEVHKEQKTYLVFIHALANSKKQQLRVGKGEDLDTIINELLFDTVMDCVDPIK